MNFLWLKDWSKRVMNVLNGTVYRWKPDGRWEAGVKGKSNTGICYGDPKTF